MANYTATTNMTLEAAIAAGSMASGENLTINSGAVITCDRTPSILVGAVTINQGELFIDGLNIGADNVINFVGEGGLLDASNDQAITVNGQGKLNIIGDWFDIGTTDGTNNQAIDLSTATGVGYWTKSSADFCIDVIPMIQVETGRRIDYDTVSGTTPEVGDWIYKTSDRTVMGKIKEVGSTYLIVWCFTGTLVDDDAIQCRKVVDNNGPDLQIIWTASVNNVLGDIKESGVYMEFGNCRSNGTDFMTGFGTGIGGLIFHHAFQTTTLTMGGSTGGFLPPSGCNIRVPNVIINTSSLVGEGATGTPYADGNAFGCGHNNNETEWYQIECSSGGEVYLHTCNWGNAHNSDAQANKYDCFYVGSTINMGSTIAGSRTSFTHCVVCQATELNAVQSISVFGSVQDNVNGSDVSFCMSILPRCSKLCFGGLTSIDININNCIYTGAGQGADQSTNSINGYYFSVVNGGSMTNNVYVGNNNLEQDYAVQISTSPDVTLENFHISMTQDYTEQSVEKDAIRVLNSRDIYVEGVEFIGNGTPGNNVFYLTDQPSAKIRAVGMIDEKIDLGASGEYVFSITGLCDKIDIARCWFNKTSTVVEEFCVVPTTVKEIIVQNCGSKYLAEIQPSGGGNTKFKGLHGGAGTPGAGTGWEDAYIGSYGNSFHDGFRSDTVGTIACLMIAPSLAVDETNVTAGNPLFFKDGDLNMSSGDVIEFEMNYFAKGHTGFSGTYTATTQTSVWNANEWANVTLDFQYQLEGSSWNGTWLDVRTASNWTGITGDIEKGVKLKHRFTATGTQNDMSMLLIDTTTTIADQKANFYPIDQIETTFTLNNVVVGSRYWIYDIDNTTVLTTGIASTSTVEWIGENIPNGTNVTIRVRNASDTIKYKPFETAGTVTNLAVIVYISQIKD